MVSTSPTDLHHDSIVIDATCPLLDDVRYIDWWIEGGATAAAPSVGGSDGAKATLSNLAKWIRQFETDARLVWVKQAADIERAKREGKFGIIFHFQGTEPIEDNLNLVYAYKALGVGMIQLSYNVKNRVGDGCEERTDAGLSNFGLKLIETMNAARVIVDCSHTGYRTTMDAMEASSSPVVFSHANARAVHLSPRNIQDDQAKAAAATGGLVGVVGYPAFVSSSTNPSLDQFIDHIVHYATTIGIDHVGLGIDYFKGQVPIADPTLIQHWYEETVASGRWSSASYPPPPYHYPEGIETPRTLHALTEGLLRRDFSEREIRKVMGGNWLRVFRDVWGE